MSIGVEAYFKMMTESERFMFSILHERELLRRRGAKFVLKSEDIVKHFQALYPNRNVELDVQWLTGMQLKGLAVIEKILTELKGESNGTQSETHRRHRHEADKQEPDKAQELDSRKRRV